MTKKYRLLAIALFFLLFTAAMAQPQIIAHRGYWKTNGSAQNSIAALMKADSIHVFGSETDIWLSADGIPLVFHDAEIEINGKKFTIEDTPLATLRNAKLSNGEILPTLEEYLNAFSACKQIKLIIEFKKHKNKSNEDALVKKVIDMVKERNLQHRVEYITFGINFMNQIRQFDPDAKVYYLNGDLSPAVIHAMGAAGIDYHYNVLYKYPQWIKEAHELGLKVNVWTVNNPDDIRKMIDLKVDFITTDEPLLVKEILRKQ